jgi:hypothetical protein
MRVKAIDVLRDVREVLSDPKKWTVGEYARDSAGHETDPCDGRAESWCLQGAIYACGAARGMPTLQKILRRDWDPGADWAQPILDVLDVAAGRFGFKGLVDANDGGGQGAALQVIESAMVDLESCPVTIDHRSTSRRATPARPSQARSPRTASPRGSSSKARKAGANPAAKGKQADPRG